MKCRDALILTASIASLGACAGGANAGAAAPVEATTAVDTTETASAEASLVTLATGSVTAALPATAASQAATAVNTYLLPAGCATATASGPTVTYTVANCTGPYGLALASGTLSATFSSSLTSTDVALQGSLTLRRGAVAVNLTASVTTSGTTRSATVTSMTSGSGPNGNMLSHAGAFTAVSNGACVTLDGTFSTAAEGSIWMTGVSSYHRCEATCPTGAVSFTSSGGQSVALTYSGTANVAVTDGGHTYSVALACGS